MTTPVPFKTDEGAQNKRGPGFSWRTHTGKDEFFGRSLAALNFVCETLIVVDRGCADRVSTGNSFRQVSPDRTDSLGKRRRKEFVNVRMNRMTTPALQRDERFTTKREAWSAR
jgi:hypothetical protein